MSLVTTITGLPFVGKTTLFDLLTGQKVPTGTFAGAEAETNVGVAKVPDERLDKLVPLFDPKKVTHAEITYRDLGLAKGAGKGEGISPKKLGDLRTSDALLHVVRAFRDPTVPHPEGSVDPERDLATIDLELVVADHSVAEKRIERIEPEIRGARAGGEREAKERERDLLERCLAALAEERPLRDVDLEPDELKLLRGYRFLTLMPQLAVVNLDEADVADPEKVLAPIRAAAGRHRSSGVVHVCAKLEAEIAELSPDEAVAFREEAGLHEPALDRVVRATYDLLGLISFFTVGPDECRAWTIRKGETAQQAAGAIHSDLERGFIRAEVTEWQDMLRAGSEAEAKRQALTKVVGKEAQVADGQVMNVLFNV
ncbi:MAG: redox-regulated ATPase YchF [Chloroflexota bacterium]|nr:redox-regulated ATPase YchF [Chloroflexota bacterium]MDE3193263.1 redox-regulated ATPase YchF [Chloroflexota bacterium]